MKFYEVKDEYSDYPAVIWAKDEEEAKSKYIEDIADESFPTAPEIPLDEVYTMILSEFVKTQEVDLAPYGVMQYLKDIITSTAPCVVLSRGIE